MVGRGALQSGWGKAGKIAEREPQNILLDSERPAKDIEATASPVT